MEDGHVTDSITRRRFLTFSGAVAGGALLTACGVNGDSNGSAAPTPADGGGGTATAEAERLVARLAQTTDPNFPQIPLLLADVKGYFADEGLELRPAGLRTSGMPAAISSDSVDFAYTSVAGSVLEMRQTGTDVVCFGQATQGNPNIVTVRSDFAEERGVTAESSIDERIAALEGARWAATSPGTGTDITVQYIMAQGDYVKDEDYTIAYLQEISAFIAALEQGEIDAFAVFSPIGEQTVSSGAGSPYIALPAGELEAFQEMAWSTLWSKRSVLEEKPEQAQRVTRAIWRALQDLQNDPEDAKAAMRGLFAHIEDEVFDMSWDNNAPIFVESPRVTEQGFERSLALHNYGKPEDEQMTGPVTDIFTNEIVDAVASDFS